MNELERAVMICELFRERRARTVPESIQVYSKSLGTVTSVREKGVDLGQVREIMKQLLTELSGVDLSPEAHRLLARLAATLSSNPSSTPSSPDAGDQTEKSGWLLPNSELRPAFRPGEARRGLRDAATSSKGIRGPKDAALH